MGDFNECLGHLARSGVYDFCPELIGQPEEFSTLYDALDPEYMPLTTFGMRVVGTKVLFVIHGGMMSPEAIREMNKIVLPEFNAAFRKKVRKKIVIPEQAERDVDSLLDAFPDLADF